LTNWDAAELAGMVKPGTPAILTVDTRLDKPQQMDISRAEASIL
jgi:hypothetical protein